jgi:hypothetical protein
MNSMVQKMRSILLVAMFSMIIAPACAMKHEKTVKIDITVHFPDDRFEMEEIALPVREGFVSVRSIKEEIEKQFNKLHVVKITYTSLNFNERELSLNESLPKQEIKDGTLDVFLQEEALEVGHATIELVDRDSGNKLADLYVDVSVINNEFYIDDLKEGIKGLINELNEELGSAYILEKIYFVKTLEKETLGEEEISITQEEKYLDLSGLEKFNIKKISRNDVFRAVVGEKSNGI